MPTTVNLEDGSPILPVYLICDTSSSMNKDIDEDSKTTRNDKSSQTSSIRRIDVLNNAIIDLFATVTQSPRTTTRANLSIISFDTTARINFPMSDVHSGITMTPLRASGTTRFSTALELLEKRLDIDERRRAPRRSFRPVAFFLTDGQPTERMTAWTMRLHATRSPSFSLITTENSTLSARQRATPGLGETDSCVRHRRIRFYRPDPQRQQKRRNRNPFDLQCHRENTNALERHRSARYCSNVSRTG